MKKTQEFGRSMVEMLGVLSVIGILTVGSIGGYQKATSKINLNKTLSITTDILREYAELKMRGGTNDPFSGGTNPYIYGKECRQVSSVVDGRNVCSLPLGEIYMKNTPGNRYNSFMLYVTLAADDGRTCAQFLSYDWRSLVPVRTKQGFMIWIASDKSGVVPIYSAGSTAQPDMSQIASACTQVCSSDAAFCTIAFDMMFPKSP